MKTKNHKNEKRILKRPLQLWSELNRTNKFGDLIERPEKITKKNAKNIIYLLWLYKNKDQKLVPYDYVINSIKNACKRSINVLKYIPNDLIENIPPVYDILISKAFSISTQNLYTSLRYRKLKLNPDIILKKLKRKYKYFDYSKFYNKWTYIEDDEKITINKIIINKGENYFMNWLIKMKEYGYVDKFTYSIMESDINFILSLTTENKTTFLKLFFKNNVKENLPQLLSKSFSKIKMEEKEKNSEIKFIFEIFNGIKNNLYSVSDVFTYRCNQYILQNKFQDKDFFIQNYDIKNISDKIKLCLLAMYNGKFDIEFDINNNPIVEEMFNKRYFCNLFTLELVNKIRFTGTKIHQYKTIIRDFIKDKSTLNQFNIPENLKEKTIIFDNNNMDLFFTYVDDNKIKYIIKNIFNFDSDTQEMIINNCFDKSLQYFKKLDIYSKKKDELIEKSSYKSNYSEEGRKLLQQIDNISTDKAIYNSQISHFSKFFNSIKPSLIDNILCVDNPFLKFKALLGIVSTPLIKENIFNLIGLQTDKEKLQFIDELFNNDDIVEQYINKLTKVSRYSYNIEDFFYNKGQTNLDIFDIKFNINEYFKNKIKKCDNKVDIDKYVDSYFYMFATWKNAEPSILIQFFTCKDYQIEYVTNKFFSNFDKLNIDYFFRKIYSKLDTTTKTSVILSISTSIFKENNYYKYSDFDYSTFKKILTSINNITKYISFQQMLDANCFVINEVLFSYSISACEILDSNFEEYKEFNEYLKENYNTFKQYFMESIEYIDSSNYRAFKKLTAKLYDLVSLEYKTETTKKLLLEIKPFFMNSLMKQDLKKECTSWNMDSEFFYSLGFLVTKYFNRDDIIQIKLSGFDIMNDLLLFDIRKL